MRPLKHGLGKGLDALIPSTEERTEVSLTEIKALPDQPRRKFPEKELTELAYSIRLHGILQPLVVAPADSGYCLIAGERRLRAAKLAGLSNVPVYIRSVETQQHYELALIENLQRADLSPVEEANAYRKLLGEHDITQEALAKRLGKSRSTIANALRMLGLPAHMLAVLEDATISPGHANALLAHEGPVRERLFAAIIKRGLTVRQAEQWQPKGRSSTLPTERPAWLAELETELGRKIEQRGSDNDGKLVVHYHSEASLNELVELLKRR